MTPVNGPPAGAEAQRRTLDPDTPVSLPTNLHQLIAQKGAQGEIDHPELGRIAVSAKNLEGNLDIQVTAQRAESASVLSLQSSAMLADVRAANLPVARVDVYGQPAQNAGTRDRDRDPRPGPGEDPWGPDGTGDATSPVRPGRVRIVL